MLSKRGRTIFLSVALTGEVIGQLLRHDVVVGEIVEEEACDTPSHNKGVENQEKGLELDKPCHVGGMLTSATLRSMGVCVWQSFRETGVFALNYNACNQTSASKNGDCTIAAFNGYRLTPEIS